MSTNADGERVIDIDKAEIQNVRIGSTDDGRPAWIIVGIGIVMLAILLAFNVVTLIQTNSSQHRQDRLSDCFRRVVLTINARADYNEELREVEAVITDSPGEFVDDIGKAQNAEDRQIATDKYLKTVRDARKQRSVILKKQQQFKYPDLDQCERA